MCDYCDMYCTCEDCDLGGDYCATCGHNLRHPKGHPYYEGSQSGGGPGGTCDEPGGPGGASGGPGGTSGGPGGPGGPGPGPGGTSGGPGGPGGGSGGPGGGSN
jgi:hypothetical protein